MFALVCESPDGQPMLYSSNAFPVHQYYPTGVKKTDPNEANCHEAFLRVLKLAPSTTLRRELLGRRRLADSYDAIYPSRSRMSEQQDQLLGSSRVMQRDMTGQRFTLPLSPVSSGSSSPTSPPVTPISDYGRRDSSAMDCDADGAAGYMTPRSRHPSKGYYYPEDVGEPLKNIGKSGLDAAQTLLALRASPVGFLYRDSPVR